jgi:hypothetical protein
MTNAATVAATDDEVVDPEAPVTSKSYGIKMKCVFVQTIGTLISSIKSCCASCALVGIPPLYYHCWKRWLTTVDDVNTTEEFVAYSTKGTTRRIHRRRTSVLATMHSELEAFMFKIHEQVFQLMNRMVECEASRIVLVFRHKTVRAKAVAIHRFSRHDGSSQPNASGSNVLHCCPLPQSMHFHIHMDTFCICNSDLREGKNSPHHSFFG